MPIAILRSEAFFVLQEKGKMTLCGMRKIAGAATAPILIETSEFISDASQNDW
jgi:hypothetical protein